MKSDIGFITDLLFRDKYPEKPDDRLKGKDRIKLQKQLSLLINTTDKIEVLNEALNEEKPIDYPPRFEQEFNLDENLSIYWLRWVDKAFKRIKFKNESIFRNITRNFGQTKQIVNFDAR